MTACVHHHPHVFEFVGTNRQYILHKTDTNSVIDATEAMANSLKQSLIVFRSAIKYTNYYVENINKLLNLFCRIVHSINT
jgi:hypothetical protein